MKTSSVKLVSVKRVSAKLASVRPVSAKPVSGKPVSALAFDIGAGSGRALIGECIRGDDGRLALKLTEVHRFPNEPVQVGPHLHWDILRILQEIKNGIRKAYQAGFEPVSFGIDTWGVDFGLLDRNGELLGAPYHYRDTQTQGMVEELSRLIGEGRLFLKSGLQFMPFNTIYQLYAMKKMHSPKLDMAHTLLLTPDLLAYLLTGVKVCEFTMATTTGLFHPGTRAWNKPLMEQLGLPAAAFLDPVLPGTRVGALTEAVGRELGVPQLAAVAVGSHDTESAAAAVPAAGERFAYLVCGTWSLLGTELPEALLTPEAQAFQFSNEGGVGGVYQLLKNIMGLWLLQECKRGWDHDPQTAETFAELVELAAAAPPFRSLIDPDDLRFLNPPDMEREIGAFCAESGQPVPRTQGEIVRCILESLALRYRMVLEQMELLTGNVYDGLHMVGGGIQNELLCSFTAGAFGRPVWAGPVEASAIGNLLVQFQTSGTIGGAREGKELVRRSFAIRTYVPDEGSAAAWEEAYAAYRRISRSS